MDKRIRGPRWATALGVGLLLTLGAAGNAGAATFDCGRFMALDPEMQRLYSWALVEGGIAVRASYQADAIQLRKNGDEANADGSNMVARAIAEKLRPAMHRSSSELQAEVGRRCATHKANRSITLVYLEIIDAWRRQGPPRSPGAVSPGS